MARANAATGGPMTSSMAKADERAWKQHRRDELLAEETERSTGYTPPPTAEQRVQAEVTRVEERADQRQGMWVGPKEAEERQANPSSLLAGRFDGNTPAWKKNLQSTGKTGDEAGDDGATAPPGA